VNGSKSNAELVIEALTAYQQSDEETLDAAHRLAEE
jgi:hypothetical protein